MILKAKRNIEKEGMNVNQLYPVVEYRENILTGVKQFRIYDGYGGFSWKRSDNFYIESTLLENYSEKINENTISYIHNDLNEEFFNRFHLDDDLGVNIVQIEEILIDIISDELSIEDIINNMKELGLKDEKTEMQLKAFFKKASKEDIIQFSSNLSNEIMDIDKYLLKIVVENIISYKEQEVENLLLEIYMSASCSKEMLSVINNYWN